MSTRNSAEAFSLLQSMAPLSYDGSRLIDLACMSFTSIDQAHLATLQAKHRQTVLAQFAVSSPQAKYPLSCLMTAKPGIYPCDIS